MENLHKNPVLRTTREELTSLRAQYGINNEKKMYNDIMELRDWMKTENHLVVASNYINDNILKRIYMSANGSVDETRIKIDKYCTAKGAQSEVCLNRSIDEFELVRNKIQYNILPKKNPKDLSRVAMVRFLSSDLSDVSLLSILRYITLIEDYVQSCDINLRMRLIVDYANFPLSFYMKLNPILLRRVETLFMKAYGYEVKGLHLVNVPTFIDKMLVFMKYTLSKSVSSVITVHRTYEDLQEYFPKDIIPKDYGGDGPTCLELSDTLHKTLKSEEGRKINVNVEKLITDETKRNSVKLSQKLLGIIGSFNPFSIEK